MSEYNNPLAVSLPYVFNKPEDYPTEVLANRFQAWRSVIKELVSYLKEYASVQEEIVRQQLRLQQAVGTTGPVITRSNSRGQHGYAHHGRSESVAREHNNDIDTFFLPFGNGSVQDLPTVLTRFHQQNVTNCSKTLKELNSSIIPKLEELRKDLLVKIKEIKNLQNDFKSNLGKELTETKTLLNQYSQAIELSNKLDISSSLNSSIESENGKNDPYIVRIKLERQLKRQLNEENYLYEAYNNLQSAGGKLESIIVLEIKNYFSTFLQLLETEHSTIPQYLLPHLNEGFLSKEANFEWDSFISRNIPSRGGGGSNSSTSKFIDLSLPSRKISDLSIPHYKSAINHAVREGPLERRSKFLKSYSSGWYVLTCNYLHEFRSSDRRKDLQPVMSLPLDSCVVTEHSKDDGKSGGFYKFMLSSKGSNSLIHRSHNWVFRTDNYKNMIEWYSDLKSMTSLPTPSARSKFVAKKLAASSNPGSKQVSRASSLLSGGTKKSARTLQTNDLKSNKQSVRTNLAAGSETKINEVSSTFSSKNNASPRLSNMINSDGTIITPIETYDDKGVDNSEQRSEEVQNGNNYDNNQYPNQEYQGLSNNSSLLPVRQNTPHQYISAGYQHPYYITSSSPQPQQYYDPVSQQFYTITPAMNNQGQVPQPQYFPMSPSMGPQIQLGSQMGQGQSAGKPGSNPSYFPVQPTPLAIRTGSDNQNQTDGQSNGQANESSLPYPTNPTFSSTLSSRKPSSTITAESFTANGTKHDDDGSVVTKENHSAVTKDGKNISGELVQESEKDESTLEDAMSNVKVTNAGQ